MYQKLATNDVSVSNVLMLKLLEASANHYRLLQSDTIMDPAVVLPHQSRTANEKAVAKA